MSILQLKFNQSGLPSGYVLKNMGPVYPAWSDSNNNINVVAGHGINNKNNWWKQASAPITDIFNSSVGFDTYTQYGQNVNIYGSTKFFHFRYVISNEVLNADGSVTADVTVWCDAIGSRKTDFAASAGLKIKNDVKIGNKTVDSYSGTSIDEYTIAAIGNVLTTKVTIPPQSYSTSTNIVFETSYPNGEHPALSFQIGASLYNPTDPSYTPMKVKINGQWVTLNSTNRKIKVKKNGQWVDVSKENHGTQNQENKGKNRYKKGGKWLQMPLPK